MTSIPAPRSSVSTRTPRSRRFNLEKWGWIYMRLSGVVLVALIFGHLFVNLMVGDGVSAISFGFVAGKYASPFWRIWDCVMLWLALIHGANGMRTLVNDYATKPAFASFLKGALFVSAAALIVLGTLVIFTFDPCPAGADPALIGSFCPVS